LGNPRIAILILAHRNQEQLIRLVDHLKTDFSVYIHMDRKSKIQVRSEDNVHPISKFRVYWANFSQILATRELMRTAAAGYHDRYLLISGQDLPIVSNQKIIQYFLDNNNNYLHRENQTAHQNGFWRMRYFHLGSYDSRGHPNRYVHFIDQKLHMLQDYFRVYRKIPGDLYVGCNWFNLTHEAVTTCLGKMYDRKYINLFRFTKCADEVIVQSVLYNSKLSSSIISDDLRYADWSMGGAHPKVLTLEDYGEIMNSAKLFARKFDNTIDPAVINKIYEAVG
jgi:hypothetical protein